jgi:hypothetical protein
LEISPLHPHEAAEILNSLSVVIPSNADRFEAVIGVQFVQIQDHLRENECFSAIRDALLPRLLSGELAVGAE